MDMIEKQKIIKWINSWQSAGEALDKVKSAELKNYDYKNNEYMIDQMLQWACEYITPRLSSGLIEQQQLFKKLRKKKKHNKSGKDNI